MNEDIKMALIMFFGLIAPIMVAGAACYFTQLAVILITAQRSLATDTAAVARWSIAGY